jgi:hypothetical protein
MLYTLMGPGCTRVSCFSERGTGRDQGTDLVTGVWADGRMATVRGLRDGRQDYGFTVFGDKKVFTQGVSTQYIYRELLKQIVRMFETKELPIDPRETLEIVAFIEAAKASADAGGAPVQIKV